MLHKASVIVSLLGFAVLAQGCEQQPELPMSPSTLSDGVVLFEHANFLGNSAHITGDIPDLRSFTGPCLHDDGDGGVSRDWNDCVSSVRVAPGWRVTIYKGTGYRDDSLSVIADVANLALIGGDCDHDGLNDCVSSLRVRRD